MKRKYLTETLMEKFDFGQARVYLLQRQQEKTAFRHQRFEAAWHDFREIVTLLIEHYHPRRIYQWGSLLNEATFSEISDIDIAVEGHFPPEIFFAMVREAEQRTSFSLDFVDLNKMEPEFADIIRAKGRLVYESQPPTSFAPDRD